VDLLISAAMPGVILRHVPTLPSGLPVQAGYVYFQIEKSGDVWGLVAGARSMAIYAPPEFPGLNLELIALKG
jgi:type VI secretion system protein ImpJ